MFMSRYLTKAELEKVIQNRRKEKEVNHYQYEAAQRMKHIESNWKHKNYKDKY